MGDSAMMTLDQMVGEIVGPETTIFTVYYYVKLLTIYLGFVVLLVWAYCSVVTIKAAVDKNKALEEKERAAKNR